MARVVKCGLIQASHAGATDAPLESAVLKTPTPIGKATLSGTSPSHFAQAPSGSHVSS